MSIWSQVLKLPAESLQKVKAIYADEFPIEVREVLAEWIENKISANEPEDRRLLFTQELVQAVNQAAEALPFDNGVPSQTQLLQCSLILEMKYSDEPLLLYALVQRCLLAELGILGGVDVPLPNISDNDQNEVLDELKVRVTQASEAISTIQLQVDSLCVQTREWHQDKVSQSEQALKDVIESLRINIVTLQEEQTQILDVELARWKQKQQRDVCGYELELNKIEERCGSLVQLLLETRQQVKDSGNISFRLSLPLPVLENMQIQVTDLLRTLVMSAFVLEKQPPQVLKTTIRFEAKVRLLVGAQLNLDRAPPQATVSMISELQARALHESKDKKPPTEVCGEIQNSMAVMEFNHADKRCSVHFKCMQLKKIKRAEKKGATEVVTEEKLALLFQTQFTTKDGDAFEVWVLSLPVVVIVHGSQIPNGWATITWDNAFSLPGRVPFVVPEKVTWGQMAETLSLKFASATGKGLTEENLRVLAEKIFKLQLPLSTSELNNMAVSWSQFRKDFQPATKFTFWEWFYRAMKLTQDFLRPLWANGLIMGFIQRTQAEAMLAKCQPGTFLLRFSDSEAGGITIAWLEDDGVVYNLQPFNCMNLKMRSLANHIKDLGILQFLYPDIPKDDVFREFYCEPVKLIVEKGYVAPVQVTSLPRAAHRQPRTRASPAAPDSPPPDLPPRIRKPRCLSPLPGLTLAEYLCNPFSPPTLLDLDSQTVTPAVQRGGDKSLPSQGAIARATPVHDPELDKYNDLDSNNSEDIGYGLLPKRPNTGHQYIYLNDLDKTAAGGSENCSAFSTSSLKNHKKRKEASVSSACSTRSPPKSMTTGDALARPDFGIYQTGLSRRIAIVAENYPAVEIGYKELQDIQKELGQCFDKELLTSNNLVLIKCEGIVEGVVYFTYEDEFSSQFLKKAITGFKVGSITLQTMESTDLIKPIKMEWRMNEVGTFDCSTLMARLQKLNPQLCTKKWKIMKKQIEPTYQCREVLMDPESGNVIKKKGYELYGGIAASKFKVLAHTTAQEEPSAVPQNGHDVLETSPNNDLYHQLKNLDIQELNSVDETGADSIIQELILELHK